MKRVLCAIDGAEATDRALAYAIDLCATFRATLHLVTVRPSRALVPYGMRRRHGEDRMRAIAVGAAATDRAARAGVRAWAHTYTGRAAASICSSADMLDVDVVVLGARGRGAFTNAVLGSVSRRVIRKSSRAVVVVGGARRRGVLIDHSLAPAPAWKRPEESAAGRVLARGMFV